MSVASTITLAKCPRCRGLDMISWVLCYREPRHDYTSEVQGYLGALTLRVCQNVKNLWCEETRSPPV
ncbi:hypothetical protein Mapa_005424 [Marchantia paleacea]|nr:hypothetical protein Mapa_005424 [Marchantia paleacea]